MKWDCNNQNEKSFICALFISVISVFVNPPTTTRVKISQNVDVLPKVYLVHLKVRRCQTLRVVLVLVVVSTFTGQNESTVFDW